MLTWITISALAVAASAGTVPEQIHIAYAGQDSSTGYPTGITVSWATEDMPTDPTVFYGTSSGSYTDKEVAVTKTYWETYFHHHAVLTNLKSDTQYFFVVGDDTQTSSEHSFTTANAQGQDSIKVAIIGDMGIYNSAATIQALTNVTEDVDFVWHVGDISYADDAFLHNIFSFGYENTWNKYMNLVQDSFAADKPYMVLPGNHDAECHSPVCDLSIEKLKDLSNFSAYNTRFLMPSDVSGGSLNMWYSFNYGPVHFINIDTETDFTGAPNDHFTLGPGLGPFGDQLAWFEADLAKANSERDVRPWIIVAGHRQIYSISSANSAGDATGDQAHLQAAFEDLFKNYSIDLYICGHVHGYERQQPMYKNEAVGECTSSCTNPQAPIYIIDGSAGCTEGHVSFNGTPASWNVFHDYTTYGYSLMEVTPDQFTYTYYADDMSVRDTFTIHKTTAATK